LNTKTSPVSTKAAGRILMRSTPTGISSSVPVLINLREVEMLEESMAN